MASRRLERFIIASDGHGDHECRRTTAALHEFIKHFRPTVRIYNSDAYDFAALRKGASEEDKLKRLSRDVAWGNDLLKLYRPTHFNLGNHDARLWLALKSKYGLLADLAKLFVNDITKAIGNARVMPYAKHRVLRYGDLNVMHGFYSGANAARQMAMTYGNSLQSHVHAFDSAAVPKLAHAYGYTIGSLCRNRQDYNHAQAGTLRQGNGWAYGFKLPSGRVDVHFAKKIGSSFYLPTEFREVVC